MDALAPRASRWNFLRLRLIATAVAVGLLLLGLVPWGVVAVAVLALDGGARAFVAVAAGLWGLTFLPLAWLGWKALRLAWRPLVLWRPVQLRRAVEL